MRPVSFWIMFWLLLLLPIALVVLGRRASAQHTPGSRGQEERDTLQFARALAAASSILPVVVLLLGLTPLAALRNSVTFLTLYVPIAGTLAGVCALVLYHFSGRGMERWTGSVATILAVGWLVLLVIAGWAAA